MGRKRRVGILVFDRVKLLDVAGPSEVFSEANRFGANYEVLLYSVDGRAVASSSHSSHHRCARPCRRAPPRMCSMPGTQ